MTKNKKTNLIPFFNSRLISTISVSLVLFLLGLILILTLLANNLSNFVKENFTFSVILNDNMGKDEISKLEKKLTAAPFSKSTEFISKEQALEDLREEMGENPETFLGFNPLFASIEVTLKSVYANNDSIKLLEKKLKTENNVEEVLYRTDMLQTVNDNIKKIGIVLFILATILMMISIALINNTIQLTIYSKRFTIHTMKLVGATASFIRKPFLRRNLVVGIIAAFLAIIMLITTLWYLSKKVDGLFDLLDYYSLAIVFGLVIILGILITFFATYFSVNKYIRMKGDSLYNI